MDRHMDVTSTNYSIPKEPSSQKNLSMFVEQGQAGYVVYAIQHSDIQSALHK